MKTKWFPAPARGCDDIHRQNNGNLRFSITNEKNEVRYTDTKPPREVRAKHFVWDYQEKKQIK